jgi:hypothetical protein
MMRDRLLVNLLLAENGIHNVRRSKAGSASTWALNRCNDGREFLLLGLVSSAFEKRSRAWRSSTQPGARKLAEEGGAAWPLELEQATKDLWHRELQMVWWPWPSQILILVVCSVSHWRWYVARMSLAGGHADQDDLIQGMVGVAIAASTEPVAGGIAWGCGYGCDADEGTELGLVSKAVKVVSDGDQELAGHFGSHTWKVAEHRRLCVEHFLQPDVSGGDFWWGTGSGWPGPSTS